MTTIEPAAETLQMCVCVCELGSAWREAKDVATDCETVLRTLEVPHRSRSLNAFARGAAAEVASNL
jgi:hypothetical protein